MAILKSQGTSLYFVDPATNEVVEVGCPTAITGLDTTNEQIEITCLNDLKRRYTAGLSTPSTMGFTIQLDITDPSHLRLKELHNTGDTVQWAVGFGINGGDITIAPEVDDEGTLVNPGGRGFAVFEGFITSFPFDFALNTVVTNSLTVQISGEVSLFVPTAPVDPDPTP